MENEPPFQLAKAKAIVKRLPTSFDERRSVAGMKGWDSLTTAGKFTYCMICGEDYSQGCATMLESIGDEGKIYAYPANVHFEEPVLAMDCMWSDRQRAFLKSHRSEIIPLLRTTMQSQHRVGVNLKQTIIELNASQLIPDMLSMYLKDHKDKDILSTCCVLMKSAKYEPFVRTRTFKSLYGGGSSYQSGVTANGATEKLILATATAFYRSKSS
jgi:hypothetical protein